MILIVLYLNYVYFDKHLVKYYEIQPVQPKENQSWMFIARTDVEAEIRIVWLPDAEKWFIWKDFDVEKDLRREEKGTTEDKMVV